MNRNFIFWWNIGFAILNLLLFNVMPEKVGSLVIAVLCILVAGFCFLLEALEPPKEEDK